MQLLMLISVKGTVSSMQLYFINFLHILLLPLIFILQDVGFICLVAYNAYVLSFLCYVPSSLVNMLHPHTQSITTLMQVVGVKVDNMGFCHFSMPPEVSGHQAFSIPIIEDIFLTKCVDIHQLAFPLQVHIHNQEVWAQLLQGSIAFLRNHLIKHGGLPSKKITFHHPVIREQQVTLTMKCLELLLRLQNRLKDLISSLQPLLDIYASS